MAPFAARRASLPAMTEINAARLFRRKPIRRYVGMGAAYSWLRAYHREVANALARREQSWASLVEDMALDGVTCSATARMAGRVASSKNAPETPGVVAAKCTLVS